MFKFEKNINQHITGYMKRNMSESNCSKPATKRKSVKQQEMTHLQRNKDIDDNIFLIGNIVSEKTTAIQKILK